MPVITVTAADPQIAYGATGSDAINVLSGAHYVYADDGADFVNASAADLGQVVEGGNGGDTLIGSGFNDSLVGGGYNGGIAFDDSGQSDYLFGGAGNDTLAAGTGSRANGFFYGGDGNDVLIGGVTASYLDGGAGDDFFSYGAANDTLIGGGGNDHFVRRSSDAAYAQVDGGTGENTVDYSSTVASPYFSDITHQVVSGPGVQVNLAAGYALTASGQVDTLANIQDVVGTLRDDIIIGSSGDNRINTYGLGNDYVDGGAGADFITANGGNEHTELSVTLVGGLGSDTIMGSANGDILAGGDWSQTDSGIADYLYGDLGNDQLYSASAGTGYLNGGLGEDTLVGSTGRDYLYGGWGADFLKGGKGSDYLDGDSDFEHGALLGADTISSDTFYTAAADMGAGDIDYVAGFHAGDTFGFSASLAGQVSYFQSGTTAYMYAAVSGGGYWYEGVANATVAQLQAATYFAG